MKSFLVVGLESSCTRYVSQMIALNLGLISDVSEWDGHEKVKNKEYLVVHKSLPHGSRDNFIDRGFWSGFDVVVVCTRDLNCCLGSKIKNHQRDRQKAVEEQNTGRRVLAEILATRPDAVVYSYESAFSTGQIYNHRFMASVGVIYKRPVEIEDINSKYFL